MTGSSLRRPKYDFRSYRVGGYVPRTQCYHCKLKFGGLGYSMREAVFQVQKHLSQKHGILRATSQPYKYVGKWRSL